MHGKIPHQSLLNRLLPHTHPLPHCTLCTGQVVEDLHHLLFMCPPKLAIWRDTYQKYFSPTPLADATLLSHLMAFLHWSPLSTDRDVSLPFSSLSPQQVFANTLTTVWSAHWRWIFDRTPLIPQNAILTLTRSLVRMDAELHLDS